MRCSLPEFVTVWRKPACYNADDLLLIGALPLFSQFLNLLTTPAGSMAYQVVLAFSILGTLQFLSARGAESDLPTRRRVVGGLLLLLALRLALFGVAVLGVSGLLNLGLALPIIDRAANSLSVLALVWLWAFPQSRRVTDLAFALVALLIGATTLLGVVYWGGNGQPNAFNNSSLDLAWALLSIVLSIGGVALLIVRKPQSWGIGLSMLGLLLAGDLLHLSFPPVGVDYAGAVRLAQLIAFPLLFTLPGRFAAPEPPPLPEVEYPEFALPVVEAQAPAAPPPPPEIIIQEKIVHVPQKGLSEQYLQAYLALATETDPSNLGLLLTVGLSYALVADICLLTTPPDDQGQILIRIGYDLIREQPLSGGLIEQDMLPGIANAIRRRTHLKLPTKSKPSSLASLARILSLKEAGHLLALPIFGQDKEPLAIVILLSPYSDYEWTAKDEKYLKNSMPQIAAILEKSQGQREKPTTGQDIDEWNVLQEHNTRLAQERQELLMELDRLRTQAEEQQSASASLDALLLAHQEAQDELARLESQNRELQELVTTLEAGAAGQAVYKEVDTGQLNNELRLALEEISSLQADLAAARKQAAQIQSYAAASSAQETLPAEQAEVIASIAQELRQPMSSITGYTDLLLGETIGILGALQRKFLERVKASTERISSLISDLIQITALDSGQIRLSPEAVDLSAVIDDSINLTSAQMREKDINLRVSLPEQLPRMHTDRDAVHQILIHLLQNAGAASPMEGEISLRAETEEQGQNDYVLVQVTDTGEGIPEEEMQRVFSRLYRADNPLIQGVGDTGVGLSIAKTLTEALGGRIWVDSELGQGSTFNVLLPISSDDGRNGDGG